MKRHSLILVASLLVINVTLILSKAQHYYFEEIKELNDSAGIFEVYRKKYPAPPEERLDMVNDKLWEQDDDTEENIKDKIKFPEFYHTQGTISLPFDDIIEPFEAWYAGKYNMSRIDYYYGKWVQMNSSSS